MLLLSELSFSAEPIENRNLVFGFAACGGGGLSATKLSYGGF
jgi:hypothetical protein